MRAEAIGCPNGHEWRSTRGWSLRRIFGQIARHQLDRRVVGLKSAKNGIIEAKILTHLISPGTPSTMKASQRPHGVRGDATCGAMLALHRPVLAKLQVTLVEIWCTSLRLPFPERVQI